MGKKYKLLIGVILLGIVAVIALVAIKSPDLAVLNSKGTIADQQRGLIVSTVLLSGLVVIPVFALTIGIAWKYREGNTKARYTPDWDHDRLIETIWWAVPTAIILLLGVMTWRSTHALDPYRPIQSEKKPLNVQVVALQWKWLFIYPDQKIASVNHLQIPEKTPVNLQITADAPMNSFWIPQLGGQVYAMSGMNTKLHLMANETGNYRGSSANLSGEGFSAMNFTALSSSQADFEKWTRDAKTSAIDLNESEYKTLSAKSRNNPPMTYWSVDDGLYDKIVSKYMGHGGMHQSSGAQKTSDKQNARRETNHDSHH
jgi:cytochrome o ubiquinol oxidase subunit 2